MFNFFIKKKDSGAEMAMEGLKNIKNAVNQQLIEIEQGKEHDDLYLHLDQPDGTIRLTYIMFSPTVQNEVIARCAIILDRNIEGFGVWSIDWAVAEKYRNKGFGFSIVTKAVNEFKIGMSGKTNGAFWLEAIVSENNQFSNLIASKIIGNSKRVINKETNEKVNNYLKKIIN